MLLCPTSRRPHSAHSCTVARLRTPRWLHVAALHSGAPADGSTEAGGGAVHLESAQSAGRRVCCLLKKRHSPRTDSEGPGQRSGSVSLDRTCPLCLVMLGRCQSAVPEQASCARPPILCPYEATDARGDPGGQVLRHVVCEHHLQFIHSGRPPVSSAPKTLLCTPLAPATFSLRLLHHWVTLGWPVARACALCGRRDVKPR
jgi:hypothetical protein